MNYYNWNQTTNVTTRNNRVTLSCIIGCLLTTLQLLEATDYSGHHTEILDLYEKLIHCDPLRKGYYEDMSE